MYTKVINHDLKEHKTTILIADDHPLLRQALRESLAKQPDFEIVGEAADGEEAVKLALNLQPDVAIIDIGMPKLNGLEAMRRIKADAPQIALLALTVYDDSEHILSTLEAGAAGYLAKTAFDTDVILAVRAVANGEVVISPRVLQKILINTIHPIKSAAPATWNRLSTREIHVLRLAAKGLSNKEIANHLNLSLRTIKGCLEGTFIKLNVSSRTEATVLGMREGLLKLEDLVIDSDYEPTA